MSYCGPAVSDFFLIKSDLIFLMATTHEWTGKNCWGYKLLTVHGCWFPWLLWGAMYHDTWDDRFEVRHTWALIPDILNYDQLSYCKTQIPCPSIRVINTYHGEFRWGWQERANIQTVHSACEITDTQIHLYVCLYPPSLLIKIVETWM